MSDPDLDFLLKMAGHESQQHQQQQQDDEYRRDMRPVSRVLEPLPPLPAPDDADDDVELADLRPPPSDNASESGDSLDDLVSGLKSLRPAVSRTLEASSDALDSAPTPTLLSQSPERSAATSSAIVPRAPSARQMESSTSSTPLSPSPLPTIAKQPVFEALTDEEDDDAPPVPEPPSPRATHGFANLRASPPMHKRSDDVAQHDHNDGVVVVSNSTRLREIDNALDDILADQATADEDPEDIVMAQPLDERSRTIRGPASSVLHDNNDNDDTPNASNYATPAAPSEAKTAEVKKENSARLPLQPQRAPPTLASVAAVKLNKNANDLSHATNAAKAAPATANADRSNSAGPASSSQAATAATPASKAATYHPGAVELQSKTSK